MTKRTWSKDDIEWLIENYPTTPTREIAERFNRSEQSIYTKINEINKTRKQRIVKTKVSPYLNAWTKE